MMSKDLESMDKEKFDPDKFIQELENTIEWLEEKNENSS